jgi:hypothetical protein
MSNKTISQPVLFERINMSKWVNGRPVLANDDVWCPLCDAYHENTTACQRSE